MTALILTLLGCPDREKNATLLAGKLKTWGFQPKIFAASDHASVSFEELLSKSFVSSKCGMTSGEFACAWTHYRATNEVLYLGQPCLIVEDDAHFQSEIHPEDFRKGDLLSSSCWDRSDTRISFDIAEEGLFDQRTVGLPYGTQCYFLSPEGAGKLSEFLIPIRMPSDVALGRASKERVIATYLSKVPVAVQHSNIKSHIGPR